MKQKTTNMKTSANQETPSKTNNKTGLPVFRGRLGFVSLCLLFLSEGFCFLWKPLRKTTEKHLAKTDKTTTCPRFVVCVASCPRVCVRTHTFGATIWRNSRKQRRLVFFCFSFGFPLAFVEAKTTKPGALPKSPSSSFGKPRQCWIAPAMMQPPGRCSLGTTRRAEADFTPRALASSRASTAERTNRGRQCPAPTF